MKTKLLLTAVITILFFTNCTKPAEASQQIHKKHRMFQSVPMGKAIILQKGDAKMFCPQCGMTLPMFYKTNHAADVHGITKQYCSLHCLVEDKEIKKSDLENIRVVDVKSLKFIPAKDAFYVVGSDKKGTMSRISKYAFASKSDAEDFARENGGKVMRFQEAYREAEKDFAKDSAMISKKQAMMAKKGKMMYTKMCQQTNVKFDSPATAKAFVVKNKLCQNLNPKQLQAVGLYLSHR